MRKARHGWYPPARALPTHRALRPRARPRLAARADHLRLPLVRPTHAPAPEARALELPDGDFVDLDSSTAPRAPPRVTLHGLEGSSRAGYVTAILRGAAERGWGATAINFRSRSGEPNRLARSYHSGDIGDALGDEAPARAPHRLPTRWASPWAPTCCCRLLEETGDRSPVDAAAAMSAPYDLDASRGGAGRGPAPSSASTASASCAR